MKKILSAIIAVSLTLAVTPPVSLYAAEEPEISITFDKLIAKAGVDFIEATVTVKNVTTSIIDVPIHFNPAVVKVVDYRNDSGTALGNGQKDDIGSAGVLPGQALGSSSGSWGGDFFISNLTDDYPNLSNTNGLYKLSFYQRFNEEKQIIEETLFKMRFKANFAGNADIRFATEAKDKPYHDEDAKEGAQYMVFDVFNGDSRYTFAKVTVDPVFVVSGGSGSEPEIAGIVRTGDGSVKVGVLNPPAGAWLIVAAYNGSEVAAFTKTQITAGKEGYDVDINMADADYVKAMLVENIRTLKPLCEAKKL